MNMVHVKYDVIANANYITLNYLPSSRHPFMGVVHISYTAPSYISIYISIYIYIYIYIQTFNLTNSLGFRP